MFCWDVSASSLTCADAKAGAIGGCDDGAAADDGVTADDDDSCLSLPCADVTAAAGSLIPSVGDFNAAFN